MCISILNFLSLLSFFFFFLILPRPPISTLFPYTTLFRSDHLRLEFALVGELHHDLACVVDDASEVMVDRKSTRLNSSHRCISYAVFCLKKKKKKKKRKTTSHTKITTTMYDKRIIRH